MYLVPFPKPIIYIDWQKNLLLGTTIPSKYHPNYYLQNIVDKETDITGFFLPHQIIDHPETEGQYTAGYDEKDVTLNIKNSLLYLAANALLNSQNDYNKLKKLQNSQVIAKLSPLEGEKIRTFLNNKINTLALTHTK